MGDTERQGETKTRHGGHTIKKRKQEGTQWETRGDKMSGRRTHHPTKGNKKGDQGREDLGKAEGGHLKKAFRTPYSTLFGEKSQGSSK
jgi:hypothetical protein